MRRISAFVAVCLGLTHTGCFGNQSLTPDGHAGNIMATSYATYPSGGLRRLTQLQYVNSAADLLGTDVQLDVTLDSDLANSGLTNVGAGTIATSPQAAAQYDAAARSLAKQRFADAQKRNLFVGCTPSTQDANDACAAQFVARFGARAWRAPLSAEQVSRMLTMYGVIAQNTNDPWQGLQSVTATLLASPQFIYRSELGDAQPGTSAHRLNDFEVATRLAYLLTNSTPDDALLKAAAAGTLSTAAGLRVQATRLLALPQARGAVARFLTEWLGYSGVDTITKDPNMFPNATPALFSAMQEEFRRVVTDIVFDRNDDFTTVLTTHHTFANAPLAALYGLPQPADGNFMATELPVGGSRSGFLTMAGYLAAHAHDTITAPTARGFFIRTRLLCENIPAPPANVPPLPQPKPGDPHQTMRQRMDIHRTNPTCASCHTLMDPVGLTFEHYDALGAYRDTDQGLPIDASGTLGSVAFSGPGELSSALRADPQVRECMVRQVYRQAFGQLEDTVNQPVIDDMNRAFVAGGYRLQDLLTAVIVSDAFRQTVGDR